ncbi:MAG: leucine-rich repeat protein, partial [Oscillibacter sp.]|nr:leucine-rich repeat protein [Oscillibacter sp.]
ARRDMPLGGDFARAIPAQIDSCKVFLLLLNENVYKSRHIESELGLAFGRWNHEEDIQILPLEIGDFTRRDWIRYYLIHAQSDKFPENPDEQRIQRLVKRIARLLAKEPAPQQKPTPPARTPLPTPPPSPENIVKGGKCGANVNFMLENGTLTISGRGAMWDFKWKRKTKAINVPWWDKRRTISHVEIQHGVTTIGDFAFYDCLGLTSVTIANSVTKIGKGALEICSGLTSVMIPDSVTTIGAFSFHICEGLTSVTISDNVTSIEVWAFAGCDRLTSVSVPAKADIHPEAFPPHVLIERRE